MIYLIGIVTLYSSFFIDCSLALENKQNGFKSDRAKLEWSNLLHYGPRLFKGVKSLADGKDFFLSPVGKQHPLRELEETIKSFSSNKLKIGRFKLHPQCAFPARRIYFKKYNIEYGKDVNCIEFNEWFSSLNAKSLGVVFSTSYPNNPSSLFGHTFLRIGKSTKSSLFDYTAAYSALILKKDWGPKYVYKGLTGGYPGYFDITPYYQKVNEYSDIESRDLYEYELNIPQERVDYFLAHLWELYATTHFDYFFIDENCSYLLGEVLKVAMPEWNLSPLRSSFYLPSDLVRIISQNTNAVKKVTFRPSNGRRLKQLYKRLSNGDLDIVKKVSAGEEYDYSKLNAPALDGLIGFYKFKKFANQGVSTKEEGSNYRKALLERSKRSKLTRTHTFYDKYNQPEKGHLPSKVYISRKESKSSGQTSIGFKLGFHDLLSQDIGLEPFSQFEFFETQMSYLEGGVYKFDKLKVVDIISLHPHTFFDSQWSWKAQFSNERLNEAYCISCLGTILTGGIGKTFSIGKNTIFYSLLSAGAVAAKKYSKGYEINLGIDLSVLKNFSDKHKVQLRYEIKTDLNLKISKDYYSIIEFNNSYFLNKENDVRLLAKLSTDRSSFKFNNKSLTLQLGHYF